MLFRVELAPSRLLFAGIVLSHLLALASLMFADIPTWLFWVLASGIFINALFSRFSDNQPVALLISDELVRLYFQDYQVNVLLESECYCTSWVQILHFRECLRQPALTSTSSNPSLTDSVSLPISIPRLGTKHYRVIILPDSCPGHARRRLAVLLRWHRFARGRQLLPRD